MRRIACWSLVAALWCGIATAWAANDAGKASARGDAAAGKAEKEASAHGAQSHDGPPHHAAGDPHAHPHVGEKGLSESVRNPIEFRQDLAIWSFVIFVGVLLILWKTAWKPILAGLQKREEAIAENIAAAQRQNEEAKRLLEQYERKLAAAAGQVREILEEARRDAEHTQQEILARARADAQAEKNRALLEIDTAKQQAMKDLAEEGANLAVELAGKIIRAQLSAADHRRLIQEALARYTHSTN